MKDNLIESIQLFKKMDFFFNPEDVYVYQIDKKSNYLDLNFISYGNFSFRAKNNIRYSLLKKYKGIYRCFNVSKFEIISPEVNSNLSAINFEVLPKDIKKYKLEFSKNIWGKKNIRIINPNVGNVEINCKSISYQDFENVNKDEINKQIKSINEEPTIIKDNSDDNRKKSFFIIADKLGCLPTEVKDFFINNFKKQNFTIEELEQSIEHWNNKRKVEAKAFNMALDDTPAALYKSWTQEHLESLKTNETIDNKVFSDLTNKNPVLLKELLDAQRNGDTINFNNLIKQNPDFLDFFLSKLAGEDDSIDDA
jgi:hypothetical protein